MSTSRPRADKDRKDGYSAIIRETPEGDIEPRLLENDQDPPLSEQIGRAEDVALNRKGDPLVGLRHDDADQRDARSERRNSSVSSGRL